MKFQVSMLVAVALVGYATKIAGNFLTNDYPSDGLQLGPYLPERD